MNENLGERFWSKVNKDTESGCWEWIAATSVFGHGRYKINGKLYSPHRIVLDIWEEKVEVCHKCDNPRCVKPSHLFVGTKKDNMNDAKNKGRLTKINKDGILFKGTNNSKKVMCVETGCVYNSFEEAGRLNNISGSIVSRIVNKKNKKKISSINFKLIRI